MHLSFPPWLSKAPAARATRALAVALSFGLGACGSPSAEDVRTRTTQILTPAITETAQTLDEIADHKVVSMIARWVGDSFTWDDVAVRAAPVPGEGSGEAVPEPPEVMCSQQPSSEPEKLAPEAADFARKVDEFLGKYIFNEDNVESSSGGKTTFLIKGDAFCGDAQVGRSPAPVAPLPDGEGAMPEGDVVYPKMQEPMTSSRDECREIFSKLAIRIDASLEDDGVDLGVRIGDADGALVVIQLRPDRVTVKALLPALLDAGKQFSALTGEGLPDGFPTSLKGIIAATVKREGSGARSAEVAILEAIEVAGRVDGEDYAASIPAANPLARLSYRDGEITLDAGLGITEILLPGNALLPRDELREPLDRALELFLSGMKATIRGTRSGELLVDELSFGDRPSRLTFGGETLFGVEVNPDDGHALQMALSPFDEDLPSCRIDPQLDLRAELHGEKLAPYFVDEVPSWAADERYQLLIAAANGASPQIVPFIDTQAEAVCMSGGSDGGGMDPSPDVPTDPDIPPLPQDPWPVPAPHQVLKVLSGTLTLQSFVDPQKVVVGAGSCLVVEHGEQAETLPLGGLAAGACE